MIPRLSFVVAGLFLLITQSGCQNKGDGFESMFNGKDLTGWDGATDIWSVQDGAIVGSTAKNPAKGNTFLVWTNSQPGDFEMRCSFKLTPKNKAGFANSGIQYRSKVIDPSYWVVAGYQADMDAGPDYTGQLYEERGRAFMAMRGEKVVYHSDGKKEVVSSLGDPAKLGDEIHKGDWNDYVIIAKGNHLQQFINGKQMIDLVDEQTEKAAASGVIALQVHAGPPMTVEFKDLIIKELK
jgi:hypothetical protein